MIHKIPDYGQLMTISQFTRDVLGGGYIDYDGTGYYSDGKTYTDILAQPSEIYKGIVRTDFSHIVWFGK